MKENLEKKNLLRVSGGDIEEILDDGTYVGQNGIFKGDFLVYRHDRPEIGFYCFHYNNEQERQDAYNMAIEAENELYNR